MPTTYSAIAGAEDNPGDLIPATFMNPFASFASPIMKSPVFASALSPEYVVITLFIGTLGADLLAIFSTYSRFLAVVAVSSLSSISSASGPTKRLP